MSELGAEQLAVVIPTRDRWPILQRTVAALRSQTVSGFELVVVADGLDQHPPPLDGAQVVVRPHGGAGAARNTGVRATTCPIILFLGDDTIPEPGLVEAHLTAHRRDGRPELAVLGHVGWHPEVADSGLARWMDRTNLQFDYPLLAGSAGEEVGFSRFFSCNVSLGRALFEAVDGFDESFLLYYEDLECGLRLERAGMRLIYEPAARALHLHGYDAAAVRRRFEGIARAERLMTELHPEFRPWFKERLLAAHRGGPLPPAWMLLEERIPRRLERTRAAAQRGADRIRLAHQLRPFLRAWDRAAPLCELRRYLGDEYDPAMLIHHHAAIEAEADAAPDETGFYRTSRAYLYDLTVFAMSGTKDPYLAALRRRLRPGARVLDYGCGIGSDGLTLAEAGHRVDFADFANPSTRYLRWRLDQRGLHARIFDVERDTIPGGYDAVFAFDVLEHVNDPFALLERLEQLGDLVAVNLLEPEPGETRLHHSLPIRRLLDHVRRQRVLGYRRLHRGRSHLVVYRPRPTRGVPRPRSLAAFQAGRVAARWPTTR